MSVTVIISLSKQKHINYDKLLCFSEFNSHHRRLLLSLMKMVKLSQGNEYLLRNLLDFDVKKHFRFPLGKRIRSETNIEKRQLCVEAYANTFVYMTGWARASLWL